MALANILAGEGTAPEEIRTTADCHLEMDEQVGPTITRIDLTTEVEIPVSRALGGVETHSRPNLAPTNWHSGRVRSGAV